MGLSLTSLELNGDRLVRAFHEKSSVPVSQALSIAAFNLSSARDIAMLREC